MSRRFVINTLALFLGLLLGGGASFAFADSATQWFNINQTDAIVLGAYMLLFAIGFNAGVNLS